MKKAVLLKGVDNSGASLSNSGSFLGSHYLIKVNKKGPQNNRKGGLFLSNRYISRNTNSTIDFQIFDVCSSVHYYKTSQKRDNKLEDTTHGLRTNKG